MKKPWQPEVGDRVLVVRWIGGAIVFSGILTIADGEKGFGNFTVAKANGMTMTFDERNREYRLMKYR